MLSNLNQNKWMQLLFTCALAIVGGLIFKIIHLPIPWLLGPMIAVLIGSKVAKPIKPHWPRAIRDSGMIIVGYMVGLSFTLETLKEIGKQFPSMVLFTTLLLVCSCGLAWVISKLSKVSFPTVMMGSIPGGLSQMITLAEELKGIELTVVTFLQVSRLMMIIFFVPMLVFSPLFSASEHQQTGPVTQAAAVNWGDLFPHIIIFAFVCVLAALIGKAIKFPTAFLLGPMIATILLNLSGFSGPSLPTVIINASQLMIGSYIGLMLKPDNLKIRFMLLACLSGIVLIACSIGLSLLLSKLHAVDTATSFLSLSPGGMDQMGIIAQEVHANLTFVICYQLFRTLFIFIAVPPLLKAIFRSKLQTNPSYKKNAS
ncbi:monooxygenase [Pullulanibacillus camelliae]|uniref:Monooxygenase n=2 Tax=Pullulanibacillus camelliae TaxID=1707096 RepID=A0A8J2VMY2_9BACL|nr:monooxygenase [Pullulanibacillus camelliae]